MKKKVKNVLVFPGGTEVGLEIFRSLRYCKEVILFGVSNGVIEHSTFVYKNFEIIPNVDENECLLKLNELIEKWKIDCIYPANPLVIDFLNKNRDLIKCKLILASKKVVNLTRSKLQTYKFFNTLLPIPKIYSQSSKKIKFPVFIKPSSSYGSQGTQFIKSQYQFDGIKIKKNEIVSEFLPGKEYTVDCFSDKYKRLIFIGPRTRERIRMGTSMHCEVPKRETIKKLEEFAYIIQKNIDLTGAWFFQVKEDANGCLKLLEIEARIAGTMGFNRVAGVNFPLLSIYVAFDQDVEIGHLISDIIIDRALVSRYKHNIKFQTVYVDLDDTILIKNSLNIQLLEFLFQCILKKIKIVLISKSTDKNVIFNLKKLRIHQIFDEIIFIDESDSKSRYISENNSIYIDDSFSQRMEVYKNCSIPTFDPSMIELLIDERGE